MLNDRAGGKVTAQVGVSTTTCLWNVNQTKAAVRMDAANCTRRTGHRPTREGLESPPHSTTFHLNLNSILGWSSHRELHFRCARYTSHNSVMYEMASNAKRGPNATKQTWVSHRSEIQASQIRQMASTSHSRGA